MCYRANFKFPDSDKSSLRTTRKRGWKYDSEAKALAALLEVPDLIPSNYMTAQTSKTPLLGTPMPSADTAHTWYTYTSRPHTYKDAHKIQINMKNSYQKDCKIHIPSPNKMSFFVLCIIKNFVLLKIIFKCLVRCGSILNREFAEHC